MVAAHPGKPGSRAATGRRSHSADFSTRSLHRCFTQHGRRSSEPGSVTGALVSLQTSSDPAPAFSADGLPNFEASTRMVVRRNGCTPGGYGWPGIYVVSFDGTAADSGSRCDGDC